jgi:hypothetical protein
MAELQTPQVSRQPYFMLSVTNPACQKKKAANSKLTAFFLYGSPARTRTRDRVVNSHLLYQLSYWGLFSKNLIN